jgi:hypothetical protein
VYYVPCTSHRCCFDHRNNIWQRVESVGSSCSFFHCPVTSSLLQIFPQQPLIPVATRSEA